MFSVAPNRRRRGTAAPVPAPAATEVLAVEIKQFKGDSRQTLVPRVIGRTAASPRPRADRGTRRLKLDRESFLNAFDNPEHRSVAVRLLDVADESGAVVETYANGVGIRVPCLHWKKPVGVAWLFPPSEWGKAVLRGLTADSVGTSVDLSADAASLPDEERAPYASLRRWTDEIAGYEFAKDASNPYYRTRTISYADAVRHVDRLSGSLAKVVSESDRCNRPGLTCPTLGAVVSVHARSPARLGGGAVGVGGAVISASSDKRHGERARRRRQGPQPAAAGRSVNGAP